MIAQISEIMDTESYQLNCTADAIDYYLQTIEKSHGYSPIVEAISDTEDYQDFELSQAAESAELFAEHDDIPDAILSQKVEDIDKSLPVDSRFRQPVADAEIDQLRSKR